MPTDDDVLAAAQEHLMRLMAAQSVPRFVVVPENGDFNDRREGRRLTNYLASPRVRAELEAQAYNHMKFGPDPKGWPS